MFSKYKEAESLLQSRLVKAGYTIQVEPITSLDLFYSDGAAASSYGKILFKKDNSEFVVFFPDMYCFQGISEELRQNIQAWLEEIK